MQRRAQRVFWYGTITERELRPSETEPGVPTRFAPVLSAPTFGPGVTKGGGVGIVGVGVGNERSA